MSRVATGKRSPASTRFYARREKPKLDSYDNNTIQAIFQSSCCGGEEGFSVSSAISEISHSKLSKDSSPCLFRVYWRCVPGVYPPSQERGARGGDRALQGHTRSLPEPKFSSPPGSGVQLRQVKKLLGPLRLEAVLEMVFQADTLFPTRDAGL